MITKALIEKYNIEQVGKYMILRRGEISHLKGNAVVYWDIKGDKLSTDYDIFAVNFMISCLPINDKLLVSAFLPLPFKDYESLFEKIRQSDCDIIYGGEKEFPKNKRSLDHFYKQYNHIIEDYSEIYRERFNQSIEKLSEGEKLNLIKEFSCQVKSEKVHQMTKKQLFIDKIFYLMEHLDNKKKYDLPNFTHVLLDRHKLTKQLIHLYTNQFIAIHEEKYETAGKLKREILRLKNQLQN